MDAAVEREFTEFVVARTHALLRAAYALTGDQHTAEDLLQTALAKAAMRWPTIRDHAEPYVRPAPCTCGCCCAKFPRKMPFRAPLARLAAIDLALSAGSTSASAGGGAVPAAVAAAARISASAAGSIAGATVRWFARVISNSSPAQCSTETWRPASAVTRATRCCATPSPSWPTRHGRPRTPHWPAPRCAAPAGCAPDAGPVPPPRSRSPSSPRAGSARRCYRRQGVVDRPWARRSTPRRSCRPAAR